MKSFFRVSSSSLFKAFTVASSLLLLGSLQSGFADNAIALSTGVVLTITSYGGNEVYLHGDDSSFVSLGNITLSNGAQNLVPSGGYGTIGAGEAGGAAGVVNLITSGYNAFSFEHYSVDSGYTSVLPLTPAQRASHTPLFTQTYTLPSALSYSQPRNGAYITSHYFNGRTSELVYLLTTTTPAYTLYSDQSNFPSWFHTGLSSSTPTAPFKVFSSIVSILVYYGNQLHFVSLDNNTDTIIPTPAGWAGDVAFTSFSEQAANSDDGYTATYRYANATLTGGPGQAPTGTLSIDRNMVGQDGQVAITWAVTPTSP